MRQYFTSSKITLMAMAEPIASKASTTSWPLISCGLLALLSDQITMATTAPSNTKPATVNLASERIISEFYQAAAANIEAVLNNEAAPTGLPYPLRTPSPKPEINPLPPGRG